MASKAQELRVAARLDEFLGERIGSHLKDRRKRESFAMYAAGLLGEGDRKSVEPIAARACASPEDVNNLHSKLLYFLGRSEWDDRAVRLEAARYAIEEIEKREPITTWIVDDTGFLKQGKHSVGVQRQYTGSAGKVTNCQVAVALAAATNSEQIPLDFELYLPVQWTTDAALRAEARIPDSVQFETKIELAIDMIERALDAEIPGEVILADAAYGSSAEFRNAVRVMGFDFAVGIQSQNQVVRLDTMGRPRGEAISVKDLSRALAPKDFRRITWRNGTNGKLASRFHFVRVKTAREDEMDLAEREPLWLVIEWPEGEAHPSKFTLTTLSRMSRKQIVRLIKERWRVERMFEDLKGELGLDHFEGRSYPAWHHHISVVLCCYAFISAERSRAFPPSEERSSIYHSLECAA